MPKIQEIFPSDIFDVFTASFGTKIEHHSWQKPIKIKRLEESWVDPKKRYWNQRCKKDIPFPFSSISNVLGTLSRASSKLNYGKCKEKQPLWELFAFFVWPLSLDGVPKKNFSMQSLFPWYFLMFTPYQNLLFLTLDFSLEKKFCELICIDLFKKSGIYSSRFLQGVVTASSTPKNDFIHVLHKLKRALSSPFFSLNAFFFQEKK